jgi:hypothetical protein
MALRLDKYRAEAFVCFDSVKTCETFVKFAAHVSFWPSACYGCDGLTMRKQCINQPAEPVYNYKLSLASMQLQLNTG